MYVDESGHPNFAEKASRFFSIGCVCVQDQHFIKEEEIVARFLRKTSRKSANGKEIPEFKFSHDSLNVKNKFLAVIKNMNADLGAVCIEKKSVVNLFKNKDELFYRTLVIELITAVMKDHFSKHDSSNSIKLTLDKRLSKPGIKEFNQYCKKEIAKYMLKFNSQIDYNLSIKHENSQTVKMIQVADYVVGAVQLKFEGEDSQFYDKLIHMIKYNHTPTNK